MNRETVTVIECEDIKIYMKLENLFLQNVVFILECTSNLILLKQLQHNAVIYQDKDSEITLIRDEYTIVNAQYVENLFILNIMRKNVIMTV